MKIQIKAYFLHLIFFLLVLLMVACVPRERLVYFQGDVSSIERAVGEYAAIIQPDDLLSITVFGREGSATKIFNQESNLQMSSDLGRPSYLVDEEGNIEFPFLGKVKLAGLTRNEAIQYMKGLLSNEIVDPGVSISIENFRITVLGEVSRPGAYPIKHEKISLLEAIGMAGDLTINGVRQNVMVIREEGGERMFHRVDLTSDEIFNSPVYYLSQNDVVYVEPNKNIINTSSNAIRNTSFVISIASFLITLIALITR